MSKFSFGLGANVVVNVSKEAGQVMGRAEYSNSANSYLVRYRSADGRAVEQWWQEDALTSAGPQDVSVAKPARPANELS